MATVPNIIAELGHMIDWVNTQIGCGLDAASCAQQQYDQLTAKINSIATISQEEATELVTQIRMNAMGEWSGSQIASLCSLVGTKCFGAGNGGGEKRWQEIVSFPRLMTSKEVSAIKSGNLSQKATVKLVVARAHLLGMHTLSEAAKGHITAVVATAMGVELQGKQWYSLLQDVKSKLVKLKSSAWKHRTIWLYDNPSALMAEPWYEAAYGDLGPSDDPWEIEEPEVLRSSHRRSGKQKPDAPACSAPAAGATPTPLGHAEMAAYQSMFGHGLASVLFNAAAAAHGSPHASSSQWSAAPGLAPPPKAAPAAPAPVPDPADAAAKAAAAAAALPADAVPKPKPPGAAPPVAAGGPAGAPEEPDMSGEEAALRDSIAARSALRKPSAACKRPAAANADDDDAEFGADGDDAAPAAKTAMKAKNEKPMKAMKVAKVAKTKPIAKTKKVEPVKVTTLKYAGVPTKPQPPIEYKDWKIYVSMGRKVWRTLQRGKVVDQQWSWATDPKTSWARMVKFINS